MLWAWKFIVPTRDWRVLKSDPNVYFKGCQAIAIAETEEKARESVTRYAEEMGHDFRWLEIATVRRMSLAEGATLSWIML